MVAALAAEIVKTMQFTQLHTIWSSKHPLWLHAPCLDPGQEGRSHRQPSSTGESKSWCGRGTNMHIAAILGVAEVCGMGIRGQRRTS